MFSNQKIKSLKNQLNSLTDTNKTQAVKSNSPLVTVKITGSSKVGNVYYYSWEGVQSDGTYNSAIGKSTSDSKAIASNEIGKTVSAPTFQTGDVVMLRKGARGLVLIGGGGKSDEGSTDPENELDEKWERNGEQDTDKEAVYKEIISDIVVDYNQNQIYASVVTQHIDTKGAIFLEEREDKVICSLIAINN